MLKCFTLLHSHSQTLSHSHSQTFFFERRKNRITLTLLFTVSDNSHCSCLVLTGFICSDEKGLISRFLAPLLTFTHTHGFSCAIFQTSLSPLRAYLHSTLPRPGQSPAFIRRYIKFRTLYGNSSEKISEKLYQVNQYAIQENRYIISNLQ